MPKVAILELNPSFEQSGAGFAPVIVLRYQLEGGGVNEVRAILPEAKEDADAARGFANWFIDHLNARGTTR